MVDNTPGLLVFFLAYMLTCLYYQIGSRKATRSTLVV